MTIAKYISLTLLSMTVLLVSCKPSFDNAENKGLYDEVMVIHDDVMPKMSDINKLKKTLRKEWSSAETEGYQEALTLIKQLDEADEAMMSWMADFKVPKEASQAEEKAYLLKEKEAITEVSQFMYSTIDDAKTFIEQNQQ